MLKTPRGSQQYFIIRADEQKATRLTPREWNELDRTALRTYAEETGRVYFRGIQESVDFIVTGKAQFKLADMDAIINALYDMPFGEYDLQGMLE